MRYHMVVEFTTTCAISVYQLKLWVRTPFMAMCTRYNIMWLSLSVSCDRSVMFSRYSGCLHEYNWPPRYNWNNVESGIKHHKPTNRHTKSYVIIYIYLIKVCQCPVQWFSLDTHDINEILLKVLVLKSNDNILAYINFSSLFYKRRFLY